MSKKIITAALLAAAAFTTGAYAQSYQGGYDSSPRPQQYSGESAQYYNYQGDQTTQPTYYQGEEQGHNGQYVDPSASDMRSNQPNNYARELKDGPMGTSPGA